MNKHTLKNIYYFSHAMHKYESHELLMMYPVGPIHTGAGVWRYAHVQLSREDRDHTPVLRPTPLSEGGVW